MGVPGRLVRADVGTPVAVTRETKQGATGSVAAGQLGARHGEQLGWLGKIAEISERRGWAYLLLLPSLVLVAGSRDLSRRSGFLLSFKKMLVNRPRLGTPWVGLDSSWALLEDEVFRIAAQNTVVWVVDAAIEITDPDQGRYGFGLRGGDGGEGIMIQVFQGFGSPIANEEGCAALDTAKVAEAMTSYLGLFTEHKAAPPSAPGDSFRQIMEAFKTGQTGMIFHHTGSLTEIVDVLGDKVMTAPRPAPAGGMVANIAPLFNGMPKADNVEAAWAWLAQWGQVDSEVVFLEETGYFPP